MRTAPMAEKEKWENIFPIDNPPAYSIVPNKIPVIIEKYTNVWEKRWI
jgi:hypothetical protein